MNTQPPHSDRKSQLTLELLNAIEQKEDISQRHLAQELGVALGLANSYLKRCVKKGWIKINSAPANRYLYYLTPTGFSEKARLTADFFATSLTLFRQAGDEYSKVFSICSESQWPRVVLIGLSDLTEIALMRAQHSQVSIVAIYQDKASQAEFFGVPVVDQLPHGDDYDCLVLSSMEQTVDVLKLLERLVDNGQINNERVLMPEMLRTMKYRQPTEAQSPDFSND